MNAPVRALGLSCLLAGAGAAAAQNTTAPPQNPPAAPQQAAPEPKVDWTDVVGWRVEGRAFADRAAPYDRLPAAAEQTVRKEVWDLSRQSAGMAVRFRTDSPAVHVRYTLTKAQLEMRHMPATGVSGVDLYGRDEEGRWRWVAVSMPAKQQVQATLVKDLPVAPRDWLLYLPLYNGVQSLELGVAAGAKVEPLPQPEGKPVVTYGTSIMHGACASRPGMAWPAVMGRALDREVFNFGFSGNGRMEEGVVRHLVALDASVFVVDCLPNMTPQQVAERTVPLVRQIRAAHPTTPILLVEDRTFANAWLVPGRTAQHKERRAALRKAWEELVAAGDENLHYLRGAGLLGEDDDATTDGSHPNDLGMYRMAMAVASALRPLLGM